MTERFTIKKNTDSFGGDCGYYPGKTPEELSLICNEFPEAVGFNSMGYIKSTYGRNSELLGCNLYIDQSRVDEIVRSKINIACGNVRKNITFAAIFNGDTETFIKTMDLFLYHCSDPHVINKWICVNNTAPESHEHLKTKYPFFQFIYTPPEQHPYNTIMSNIKTKYFMALPPGWEMSAPFNISLYLNFIKTRNFDQIVLGSNGDVSLHTKVAKLNKQDVYKYNYSKYNPDKQNIDKNTLEMFEKLEDSYNARKHSSKIGHHCPGFSFSLSIIKLEKLRGITVRENNANDELEFAFKCLDKDVSVAFTKI